MQFIYTAGFEVGDKEIVRKLYRNAYTHVPDLHVCIYCPEGRTKGANDKTILYLSISSTLHLNLPEENRTVEYNTLGINTFLKLKEFQIS